MRRKSKANTIRAPRERTTAQLANDQRLRDKKNAPVAVLDKPIQETKETNMPVTHEEAPDKYCEQPLPDRDPAFQYVEVESNVEDRNQGRNMWEKFKRMGFVVDDAETKALDSENTRVYKKPVKDIEAANKPNMEEWKNLTHGAFQGSNLVHEVDPETGEQMQDGAKPAPLEKVRIRDED